MERFCEAIVWGSGKFRVDESGAVWRGDRRAENKTGRGYLQVRVMINTRRWYTCAHRIVWHALNGPIPKGLVVNHKNGIKFDNRPENLELVTPSQNLSHAHRTGLIDQRGERNPHAKLTNREVAEIRLVYSQGGRTQEDLGIQYGVTFQTISDIVRGKRRISQLGEVADYTSRRQSNSPDRDPLNGRFLKQINARHDRHLDGRMHEEMP